MIRRDILIEGGIILTMDPRRRIIEDGALAIQGNKIAEVGKREDLKKKYPAPRKLINAHNKLVMPGLINIHQHLFTEVTKGIMPGNYGYGNPWIQRAYDMDGNPYWNEERSYLSALLTAANLIKHGTTSVVDFSLVAGAEDVSFRVIRDSGLRAAMAMEVMDIFEEPGYTMLSQRRKACGSTQENVARLESLIKKYHKSLDGRLTAWACIVQVPNASDELFKRTKEVVDKYETGLTTHANVMRPMTELTEKAWGKPDTQRLGDLGIIDRNVLLVHAADLNGKEVMVIRDNKASIAHCIFTSMNLAYGASLFSNFPAWLEMGINIGIGTDGSACCNHCDMFRAMSATFLVNKEGKFDCNLWPPQTVLEMATLNGAKAMLLEKEIGSLEVGKKADVILIDLMRPEWVPWHKYNLIETLILGADGNSVDTSIIDGKVVMEGQEIETFNERELLEKVQADAGELIRGFDYLGSGKPYPEGMPPLW